MASRSKQVLYKPAENSAMINRISKSQLDQEKRKLVQGRLVVSSGTSLPLENKARKDNMDRASHQLSQSRQRDAILDLSDTDSSQGQISQRDPYSVLVMDASRPTHTSYPTEVDIVMAYEQSPAKIICHSGSTLDKLSRGDTSGLVTHHIPVDNVPTICARLSPPRSPPPRTIRVHTDVPTPTHIVSVISPLRGNFNSENFPQPDFDCSLTHLTSGSRSQIHIDSDSGGQPEIIDIKPSHSAPRGLKKREKPKVKVVASRHMQAAKSQALSEKAQKKSNTSVLSQPSKLSADRPPPSQRRKVASEGRGTKQGRECKTSTPTQELQFFETFDASAIAPDYGASFVKPSHKKEAGIIDLPVNLSQMSFMNNISAIHGLVRPQPTHPMREVKREVTQDDIDLHYARYLQWLFMDSSVQKAFNDQQKTAMAQLMGLHERVEEMRQMKADLETELIHLRHGNKLDQHLEVQRLGLGPVVSKATQFAHDHGILASAVDTTRHQVITKGIHLGSDEELLQDGLVHALRESEALLGQISTLTKPHAHTHDKFSAVLSSLVETCVAEQTEVAKGRELVSALRSLTLEESSLQIQALQWHDAAMVVERS